MSVMAGVERYSRRWPLPPAVGRAIRDNKTNGDVDLWAVQDLLDRWYVTWLVVLGSVIVLAAVAGAIGALL